MDLQEELKKRHLDDNIKILTSRVQAYDEIAGSRVGDYLEFPDGSVRRIAHHWGDAIQPTSGLGDSGSFYFGNRYVSYSGALNSSIPVSQLEATESTRSGWVWFFDRDWARAQGGVNFTAPFRVFRVNL